LSPGDARVGLRLVRLQPGANILADVDVGDVDRDDLERGLRIQFAGQHGLGNHVGVFQHLGMWFPPNRWR
jgi:hypothetical protein